MRIFNYIVSLLFSLSLWSLPTHAASFDCSKASTETEKAICNDNELGALDERLSNAYAIAKKFGNAQLVKSEQKSWLKLRDTCGNSLCIKNKYVGRLRELETFDYEYQTPIFSNINNCTEEDYRYAKDVWENYYDPEIAYRFGESIKKALINKDLGTIASWIDGELDSGFRKETALSLRFDEVIPREDVLVIMGEQSPCQPVGWRGFMLGYGQAWYDCRDTTCSIRSISSSSDTVTYLEGGWKLNEGSIHPKCLSYPMISGDNFEEFADAHKIDNYSSISTNPGLYLGGKIKDYTPIKTDWCWFEEFEDGCLEVSLVNSLNTCSARYKPYEIDSDDPTIVRFDDVSYVAIDRSIKNCNSLAPDLPYEIIDCRLVYINEETGGTMGSFSTFGIYGLAEFPTQGQSIFPLKFFENYNEALNFIDENNS